MCSINNVKLYNKVFKLKRGIQYSYQSSSIFKKVLNQSYSERTLVFFALSSGVVSTSQIETAFNSLSKVFKNFGSVITLGVSKVPVTRKPLGVRMGSGKGSVSFWAVKVRFGQPLFRVVLYSNFQTVQFKASVINKLKTFPINLSYKFFWLDCKMVFAVRLQTLFL